MFAYLHNCHDEFGSFCSLVLLVAVDFFRCAYLFSNLFSLTTIDVLCALSALCLRGAPRAHALSAVLLVLDELDLVSGARVDDFYCSIVRNPNKKSLLGFFFHT